MLCTFFDAQSVIYQNVVPLKAEINAVYYGQVLKLLQKHIRKKRLEIARSWILHQDNARPHVTSTVHDFLKKREIPTVAHPPYSLDLAPLRFLVISIPTEALWGRQLSSNQILFCRLILRKPS